MRNPLPKSRVGLWVALVQTGTWCLALASHVHLELSEIRFALTDFGFGRSFAHDVEYKFILVDGDLFILLKFRYSRVCVP